jgi:hypothetical protein
MMARVNQYPCAHSAVLKEYMTTSMQCMATRVQHEPPVLLAVTAWHPAGPCRPWLTFFGHAPGHRIDGCNKGVLMVCPSCVEEPRLSCKTRFWLLDSSQHRDASRTTGMASRDKRDSPKRLKVGSVSHVTGCVVLRAGQKPWWLSIRTKTTPDDSAYPSSALGSIWPSCVETTAILEDNVPQKGT